jgi:hypothetical protein
MSSEENVAENLAAELLKLVFPLGAEVLAISLRHL